MKMPLKIFSSLILSSCIGISLFASSDILSNTQNNILGLSAKKAKSDVSKLEKDWIDKGAINYNYTYTKTDNSNIPTSKISTLRLNQSIFRSGGIYYAIKYASSSKKDSDLLLKINKQNTISSVYNNVYNIKKLNIQIQKQNLSLKNAIIDYENKKESVFNGLLDISFLNNALLVKNQIKIALLDLQLAKQKSINTLSTLSDLSYDKIPLPKLDILSKDQFEKENLNIKKSIIDIKKQNSLSGVSNAQYLPKVSVNYNKIYDHTNNNDSYNYGFRIDIPIDFQTLDVLQSNKIAVLEKKENQKLIKQKEDVFFKSIKLDIENIDQKISLTKQNIDAYSKLVSQTKEQYEAGLKTKNDLNVLTNSKHSEELSVKIYEIDKQLKLLELYTRINNDKI